MFKKIIYAVALMLLLVVLTACSQNSGWENELQANPVSNPEQAFVNVHVINNFDHDVTFTLDGFEYYKDGEWVKIPLNPDHNVDDLLINLEVGTDDFNTTSSIAGFVHYLNPNYPTTGMFRLVGQMYDVSGNYLKTLTSNEFEIVNFSFEEE